MKATARTFRDLRVWQLAHELCMNIYKISARFPNDERFGLTSQMRRAAVSVPSNIAEGFGRRSAKEKEQFYRHSLGSLFELDTQLELAIKLGFAQKERHESIALQLQHCQAMLIKLLEVNSRFINH